MHALGGGRRVREGESHVDSKYYGQVLLQLATTPLFLSSESWGQPHTETGVQRVLLVGPTSFLAGGQMCFLSSSCPC